MRFFTAAANQGSFGTVTVNGQAANLGTQNITQTIAGATYSVGNDGSGTASFPVPSGGGTSGQLVGGTKVSVCFSGQQYFHCRFDRFRRSGPHDWRSRIAGRDDER